jgi:hypothetical protein
MRLILPKLDRKIFSMLRILESKFIAPLGRRIVLIISNINGLMNLAWTIFKKLLLAASWLKFLSYLLDTYASTQAKIKDIGEIASSLHFVGSVVSDKLHWTAENGPGILNLMYSTLMLFFLSTGMHFFAFVMTAVGIYHHWRRANHCAANTLDN